MRSTLLLDGVNGSNLITAGVVLVVIAALLAYWVYTDATKRGNDNAVVWALGIGILTLLTLIGGLIGLGIYLYTR